MSKEKITFGSVCSGIEAASVAWNPIGWEATWLAEIEPFPAAVLKHHYTETPNLGDMTTIADKVLGGEVEAPDVLVGGTPCQSFSVAGLRGGLEDDRGQLTLEYVRLADAMDTVRLSNNRPESIIVWENVPGVLSAKDNAFGCFLGALAGEDCELQPAGKRWSNAGYILGPQRAIAWRILDAQHFGLAQRRKRVFVVASARDGFCPAKVLFEFDGVRRDSAPSREAGQEATGNVGAGFTPSSFGGYREGVGTLRAAGGDLGGGSETLSVGKWPADIAFNSRQDPHSGCREVNLAKTLDTTNPCPSKNQGGIGVVCIGGQHPNAAIGEEVAPTLTEAMGVGGGHIPIINNAIAFNSRQDPVSGEVAGALDTCSPQAQAIAYGCTPTRLNDTVNTITASYGQGGVDLETKPLALVTAIADDVTPKTSEEIGFTLSATDYKCPQAVHSTSVRRLTPIECERLQGFPDGYTAIPWRNKPAEDCPDGHRYKALGNSMAVPVMRWIGRRIEQEILKDDADLRIINL